MREAASLRSRGLLREAPPVVPTLPDDPGFTIIHIGFRKKPQEAVYGDLAGTRAAPVVPVVVKRSRRPRPPSQEPTGNR